MKRTSLLLFWFSSALIALILLVSCNDRKGKPSSTNRIEKMQIGASIADLAQIDTSQRESITFILGEDKDTQNPYYTEATKYYQYNISGKTTYLEIKCRSLVEVRNYLVNHAPGNKKPWGLINLVSHGDQWLGLSVKVAPDSKRATLARLQEYVFNGTFSPLSDSIIDQQSEIAIHACGIGNNPEFIKTLGMVFKSTSFIPEIRAPHLFEFYSTETNKAGEPESRQYMTQAWMISFKKGEQPGNIAICNMFHEKYPNDKIEWQDALNREHPRFGGDIYSYTFDIPVNLVINISSNDSIPDLSTTDKKLQWINQQSEIQNNLQTIQIPAEKFAWNLKSGFAKNKAGKRTPAIMVKGFCTMLCVLKPLLDNNISKGDIAKPLAPAKTDSVYYYLLEGKNILENQYAQK